jgi:hypothetical protein
LNRERINLEAHVDLAPWLEELAKQKILKIAGEDILRWGYRPQGTFSTREAYQLKSHLDPLPDMKVLHKLWSLKHWPKITLFIWLVTYSSILTWDNLSKRGFVGPSLCILCGEAEETMNHLLNSCHYTTQIWDQAALIMRTSDRHRDSILETIANWRDEEFHSPLLNRIWQLLPGFILLKTWKERNIRLFRSISLLWQQCWHQCHRNILETLHLQNWSDTDLTSTPSELPILRHWTPLLSLQALPSSPLTPPSSSSYFWYPLLEDFIKLNFDGASKGNPGAAGFGVVFRNHNGHILLISAGFLGNSMNNAA